MEFRQRDWSCKRERNRELITVHTLENLQLEGDLSPIYTYVTGILFVLRFYGPVNPMGSCRARSVYLTTCLLGRLSPLSG